MLVLLLVVGYLPPAQAQERCGTMPFKATPQQVQFEQWIQEKTQEKRARTAQQLIDGPVYQIPVVVHVVHLGESVGEGRNISLEQIEDQIRILNEDFRRQNPDTTDTQPLFKPVAADVGVEFVLARQTPDGLPTNGVVRVVGAQDSFSISEGAELGALSQWNPENYFNIWVTRISGGKLGFAQLPISRSAARIRKCLVQQPDRRHRG